MQNNFLEFGTRKNIKHAQSLLHGIENFQGNSIETNPQDIIGGIFRDGQFGWIVVGSHIEIVSLKNGNRIADYTFGDRSFRSINTFITFVVEVKIAQIRSSLLAIGVQSSPRNSFIYLFAVDGSRIINSIEIEEKVTSCCFIESQTCADSALSVFDGCIVVGTEAGQVIIIDLFVENCVRVLNGLEFFKNEPKLCKIVSSTMPLNSFKSHKLTADANGFGFGVQLEDLGNAGSVLSMLCLTPLLIIAVGFEDGKMLLYDLCTLDAFHVAHPPENDSPLEKLTFIEPADDPRACVYLWCFHSNERNAIAVLHSLTYERKTVKQDGSGLIYKNFDRCSSRLTMPIFEKSSKPISCQSITKFVAVEENFITLCLLAWTSSSGAYVCVFDLNQWYKQHMPDTCDWRSSPTFLAIFPLGKESMLDVWMNGATVSPFSSLNRPEEHFYPSSLSFDCALLTTHSSENLHWLGLQNQALEHFNRMGPYAILEPNRCFADMVRASLIPQFNDYSYDMNQSLKSKREFLLSIALEYNCIALLRKCAIAWADGSHQSKQPLDGLCLSTLTEWIWNRTVSIKDSCNDMCIPLFDHSGGSIEPRSQKVLLNFSRQLKRLFQLMDMIVTTCRQHIPGQALDTLQSQRNSICMATEYQEVLQWLLNMGLLPEVDSNQLQSTYTEYRDTSCDEFQAIPYPYQALKSYYSIQRRKFGKIDPNLIVPKTKSCRILYIDAFIENECNSSILRSEWKKGMGDGLYPPASLQAMLRTLLVPGVAIERKYMLFVYLFMDLSTVLRDERYSGAIKNLIKFPAVFKMDPGLIKITQAFWNLDHGEYESAIDEIISPLAQDQNMSIWQRELLIEALIINDVPHLALRALHAPGSPISPSLEIKTLLTNDLVADAFQVQRMKRNRELLFEFFRGCHEQRKWHYLLNLSLNDREEECLGQFLRSIESSLGENIHFLYLLRRCKYLEAITFIDDLQQKKRTRQLDLATPNTILSTYRLTMTPSSRYFSDLYCSTKNNINVQLNQTAKCPKPLSSRLSQRKFDLLGGVYHQSLLHTEQTGELYWENQRKKMCGLTPSNVPFLRGLSGNPSLYDNFDHQVCHPQPFDGNQKRRLSDCLEEVTEAPVAKRYRIDYAKPNINSTLLTSFKEKPNTSMQHPKPSDNSIEMEDESDLMETILSTPIVKSHREKPKKSYSLAERINTPLSILKGRSIREKSVSSVTSRRSIDSDERSIRFNLPNDNDDLIATSSPTVPDIFNFGITSRKSIHSEIAPGTPSISSSHNREENQPSEIISAQEINTSQSPGRKRLRSLSSEDDIVNCVDVSIEQLSKQMPRNIPVSSENSSEQQSEIEIEQSSDCREAVVSERQFIDCNNSENLKPLSDSKISCVPEVVEIDDIEETSNDQLSSFVRFTNQLQRPTTPKVLQRQPIERIIPIEIEERFVTKVQPLAKTTVDSETSHESNKTHLTNADISIEKCPNTSAICTPLPHPKNLFSNTSDIYKISGTHRESTAFDESSVFKKRNLFSDLSSFSKTQQDSSEVSFTAENVDDTKTDDILTVQIEDSEDSPILIGTTEEQKVETKSIESKTSRQITIESSAKDKNESTLKSSTPFNSKKAHEHRFVNPFSINNITITPLSRPRNIILSDDTDAELNETSYYKYSDSDSSIFKNKNLFTDSFSGKEIRSRKSLQSVSASVGKYSTVDATKTIKCEKRSAESTIVLNADGNDDEDDSPILIDTMEMSRLVCKTSNSTSPDFNEEENSYDIYEVSSEIDAALRDEDYDVEDYDESDSENEVIDISSGTEDFEEMESVTLKPTNQQVSQSQNTTVNSTLPPSNVKHKSDNIGENVNVSVVDNVVDSTSDDKTLNPLLLDTSKYSEVSFMTASEGSANDLNLKEHCDEIVAFLDEDKVDDSINEKMNLTDMNQLSSDEQDLSYAVLEQVKDNIASVEVDENQLDVQSLNKAMLEHDDTALTNVFLGQAEGVVISAEELTDPNQLLRSDLNQAVVHYHDITMESLKQTGEVVTDANQLGRVRSDLNQAVVYYHDVTIESLKQTEEVVTDANQLSCVSSDLNKVVVNSDDITMESPKQIEGAVISSHIVSDNSHLSSFGSNLNDAILRLTEEDITSAGTMDTEEDITSAGTKDNQLDSVSSDLNNVTSRQGDIRSEESINVTEQVVNPSEVLSDANQVSRDLNNSMQVDEAEEVEAEDKPLDSVSSDLNMAILHTDDDLLKESLNQTHTIAASVATLSEESELGSATCDLNKAVVDNVTELLDSTQVPPQHISYSVETLTNVELEIASANTVVNVSEENESHSVSSNLNKAVLHDGDRVSVSDEAKTICTVIEVDSQQTDDGSHEQPLDTEEILESAVHPEEPVKIDTEEDGVTEKNEVEKLKMSSQTNLIEIESELPIKRRLRSNSTDARTEPIPNTKTRKRSGSFTPTRSSGVKPSVRSKSVSSEAENAAVAVTTLQADDSFDVAKMVDSSISTEAIPKKVAKLAKSARSELADQVMHSTDSTKIAEPKLNASPKPFVYATRTRTRSMTDDNDDIVSIASENSGITTRSHRSARSIRSTQSESNMGDDKSSTMKRTRSKPKLLPVITEDLSTEAEGESYSDSRRLTRAQRALMSNAAGKMVAPTTTIRKRRLTTSDADADPHSDDDRASVNSAKSSVSTRSKKSTDASKPVRQSKRLMVKEGSVGEKSRASDESDKESIKSTSTTNSTRRRQSKGSAVSKK